MSDPITICFDIDGVLATGGPEVYGTEPPSYELCQVVEETAILIQGLQDAKVKVVLYSARFEEDRLVTEQWLKGHAIAYDELHLGKPRAEVYVDDRGFPFRFKDVGFSIPDLLKRARTQRTARGAGP